MSKISLVNCKEYIENPFVCDDVGEPKGQCVHCGAKWYEHNLDALPEDEKESAKQIQKERGIE